MRHSTIAAGPEASVEVAYRLQEYSVADQAGSDGRNTAVLGWRCTCPEDRGNLPASQAYRHLDTASIHPASENCYETDAIEEGDDVVSVVEEANAVARED